MFLKDEVIGGVGTSLVCNFQLNCSWQTPFGVTVDTVSSQQVSTQIAYCVKWEIQLCKVEKQDNTQTRR